MFMSNWITQLKANTVVVHTRSGDSVRGILIGVFKDSLVIAHATLLQGDTTTNIDGEVVVPRDQVAWLQTLTADGMLM